MSARRVQADHGAKSHLNSSCQPSCHRRLHEDRLRRDPPKLTPVPDRASLHVSLIPGDAQSRGRPAVIAGVKQAGGSDNDEGVERGYLKGPDLAQHDKWKVFREAGRRTLALSRRQAQMGPPCQPSCRLKRIITVSQSAEEVNRGRGAREGRGSMPIYSVTGRRLGRASVSSAGWQWSAC